MQFRTLFHVARPQALHLGRGGEKVVELPLGIHATVLEHDDVVGATEGRSTVGDGEDGAVWPVRQPLPEGLLGLDVEAARQVVEYE